MNRRHILLIEDSPLFNLEADLKATGYTHFIASFADNIPTLLKELKPDIVILNVSVITEATLLDLQKLTAHKAIPAIIFTDSATNELIDLAIKAGISELIINNLRPALLDPIIKIAVTRFKHQQALKIALEEALEKLENRKLTDRAKAILIKTQNFSEDEAYHTLRKLAMDRKITLGEMAKNVIAMSELFK